MKTEEIEYNGQVFTCQKIIDFSAMIELLSALARKQEYLEKKINFHDERINDKDKRLSELEVMIKGASQSKEEIFPTEKNFDKDKEQNKEKEEVEDEDLNDSDLDSYLNKDIKSEVKDKVKEQEKEEGEKEEGVKEEGVKEEGVKEENKNDKKEKEEKEEKDGNKDEEKKEEENKKKNEDEEHKEIKLDEKTTEKVKQTEANKENENININDKKYDINNNDDILKKIIKKLKTLEAKVNNLEKLENTSETKTTTIIGNSGIKISEGRINALNKKIVECANKQKKMQEEISKIKEKIEDFNIYDLFKMDSGDENIEICKEMVMALENKVFKKFGFCDAKLKKNDGDIFQNQSDIKNINALIDGIQERENKTNDEINEVKNNNQQKYEDLNKIIKEIKEKINEIDETINKNNKKNTNEHKELGDKIKELEQKMQQQNDNIDINKYVKKQGQMNPDDLKLLKELSIRINEVEKKIFRTR